MPGGVAGEVVRRSALALAVYLALLAAYLLFPGKSQLVAAILFYAVLGQAFNIFMGMTGYVDFGYVAFLAMGAYGMAFAFLYFNDLGWAAIALGYLFAAALAAMLSGVVGSIALRLRGAYFAIATIGVNEGIRYFIEGADIAGGSIGLFIVRSVKEGLGDDGFVLIATVGADMLLFALAIISVAATSLILSTRLGYALQAIREDEDAARALGINVTRYKIMAFMVSGVLAGMLGATFWTLKGGYVEPARVFQIHYTVEAIVIVMLGGAGTVLGPVVGAIVYQGLNYFLNVNVAPLLESLGVHAVGIHLPFFALILLAVIVAMPEGVVGYVRSRIRDPRVRVVVS